MIIAIASDLHYPTTSKEALLSMIDRIKMSDVDTIVIAGDIAEVVQKVSYFTDCLSLFTAKFKTVCICAGNHDLWNRYGNSLRLWEEDIPKICKELGVVYLEKGGYVRDGVAIEGSYLHYDYSAKTTEVPLDDKWYAQHKRDFNNDAFLLNVGEDDITFAGEIGQAFMQRLQIAHDNPLVEKIMVVTHVPCMDCQIVRRSEWLYSNAYFGNITYEQKILGIPKVKWVFSGHSHCGTVCDRLAGNRTVHIETINSQYGNPTYVIVDTDK